MITLAIEHAGESSSSYYYFLLIQGNALAKLGRYHQAKASLTTAKTFYESSRNHYYLFACRKALGVVERELGNLEEATRLHESAIEFYWDKETQSPSNLYSFLMAKSESVITNIRKGDVAKSRAEVSDLEKSYEEFFGANRPARSLPEKTVLYALASYATSIGDTSSLVKYRNKLAYVLNETPADSYSLEKARLEQLSLIEDLQQDDLIAAENHFQALMSHVNKTRDQVRVVSFQRGYSNLVEGFAEPLIEKLALGLEHKWEPEKADALLRVLSQIQGASVVEASRAARSRIARGAAMQGGSSYDSLSKEVEVFTAQNQTESYALRAQADHSVLRENVLQALSLDDSPESFVEHIESVTSLVDKLRGDEIYLNSFNTKAHTYLLYLSKFQKGVVAVESTKDLDRIIASANQMLIDRYSKPKQMLERIGSLFSLSRVLAGNKFRHVITTGDGKFSDIPFSTYSLNKQYLGTYISNTHITSTSYYFAPREAFDIEKALTNDIAVIADPNFSRANLMSFTRGGTDENFQNWISSLSRLPWTAKESQSISAAFPNARIALRTKEDATSESLRDLASTSIILHIATHGYFSSRTPELAGLALTETASLSSGFLSTNQLSKLDIASRLVVFSACETAISEESAGDSGWGLAQVALYAGARNAVGTLWKVPDRQTALFFDSFYNTLADGQSDISTALLEAKKVMVNSRYSHPFYWAGFKSFASKRIDTQPFSFQ